MGALMIYLTEKAAKQIKEISDSEGIGHYVVRAKVFGSGCNGYQNDLSFDEIFEFDGVKLIVDMMSFQYLDEICIDYVESDFGGGFKFAGGGIKSSCGC